VAESWLVPLVAGLFGLIIGSFLNVCTLRWPKEESVVTPRSRCPKCGEQIRWYDNVPIVSWVLLRGRCRYCSAPVSVQYPPEAVRGATFLTILFGVSISDARFYIIPDEFSLGGSVFGLGLAFLPGGPTWLDSLLGGAVGFVVLWLVGVLGTRIIKKVSPGRLEEAGVDQAMGGGDVKMMMMVGTFVGIWGVALTIFLGSVLALLVFGPVSMISKRLVPLGVFLAAAGAIAYAWGEPIIRWYTESVVGL
jgi:leader peptidase (prepilin peptidase)/N-methyltransferase